MKAVIVDLQGKYAAALDETGSVVRIPDAAYRIGQEIELHTVPSARPNMRRKIAATAAAAKRAIPLRSPNTFMCALYTKSRNRATHPAKPATRVDKSPPSAQNNSTIKLRALRELGVEYILGGRNYPLCS